LQFSLQAASPETSGYTLVLLRIYVMKWWGLGILPFTNPEQICASSPSNSCSVNSRGFYIR
jgi:hypothetical protein